MGKLMAEWSSVEGYIKGNYVVAEQDGKWLHLDFDLGGGRGQRVTVTTTGALVQFISPFARLSEVSIHDVFEAMRDEGILLGITSVSDVLLITHSQLLATTDQEEVDMGLHLVTQAADTLESRLSRTDRF
jgi:hypothetical protein